MKMDVSTHQEHGQLYQVLVTARLRPVYLLVYQVFQIFAIANLWRTNSLASAFFFFFKENYWLHFS